MEQLDLPVIDYADGAASFLTGLGYSLASDGVWRNGAGSSFAQAMTGKTDPVCHVRTWGCQMNEMDSEHLSGQLGSLGYNGVASEEQADVLLLNTCAVRQTAAEHTLGEVGRLKAVKVERPDMLLGVCGCLPQMPETVEYLQRHAPHVDLVFGTHNLHTLAQLLHRAYTEETQTIDVWRQAPETVEHLPAQRKGGLKAWINVIYGCDKYCTYCIVPSTRGRERSRRPGDIVAEVAELAAGGYREFTLLGQNVNSYGHDLGDYDFADLLTDCDRIPGVRWLRYMTSHPRDFTPRLIGTIASLDKVCEHFHLPVQSGSDRVLRWMNRGYTAASYLEQVRLIRRQVPEATITTDIIVGFPRETEEDFLQTLALVEEVGFDNAFTFQYSPRAGTPAARWEDPVPPEVKKQRLDRLNALQYRLSRQSNERLVGRTLEALIEGPSRKNPDMLSARTRGNRLVLVPRSGSSAQGFADVRITGAQTWTLSGELVGSACYAG